MNYEDLDHCLHPIVEQLTRIAAALEVIAGDIQVRKENERTSVIAQREHLEREADRAGAMFSMADRSAINGYRDDGARDWHRRSEQAMLDADAALRAFEAAHPWLAEAAS